jgi:hypothetical protein
VPMTAKPTITATNAAPAMSTVPPQQLVHNHFEQLLTSGESLLLWGKASGGREW